MIESDTLHSGLRVDTVRVGLLSKLIENRAIVVKSAEMTDASRTNHLHASRDRV